MIFRGFLCPVSVILSAGYYFEPIDFYFRNGKEFFPEREMRVEVRAVAKEINAELDARVFGRVRIAVLEEDGFCHRSNGKNEICFIDLNDPETKSTEDLVNQFVADHGLAYLKRLRAFATQPPAIRQTERNSDCDIYISNKFLLERWGFHDRWGGLGVWSDDERYGWEPFLQTLKHEILHCRGFTHLPGSLMSEHFDPENPNNSLLDDCQRRMYQLKHETYWDNRDWEW